MRMMAITAQILIGVTLLWLGLNGLLHLAANLPLKCIAPQSIISILLSPYIVLLFGLQLLGSLLLLVGRWNVLALVLLGPIALNIVFFHVFMGREQHALRSAAGVCRIACDLELPPLLQIKTYLAIRQPGLAMQTKIPAEYWTELKAQKFIKQNVPIPA